MTALEVVSVAYVGVVVGLVVGCVISRLFAWQDRHQCSDCGERT